MKNFTRLISIDPGLTCSGWSLFDIKHERLLGVGKIRSKKEGALSIRLLDFQEKVSYLYESLNLGKGDILVCEEATTMIDPRSTIIVEQVRCIFEVLARQRGVKVPGRINPRTVQYEVMGLCGKQVARDDVKQIARDTVKSLYSDMLKNIGFPIEKISLKVNQDIMDSILIGAVGLSRIGTQTSTKCNLEDVFTSNFKRRRR